MPTYTYRCEHCGVRFDQKQSFDDKPLTDCPECGEPALRKLYLPVGIVFKGSGFYSTDHRRSAGNGTTTTTKKEESTSTAKAESSSSASSDD